MLKVAGGNLTGALQYQGTWNASTNTPTLVSGVGIQGAYYVVSVAGSTNLDGTTLWGVGDWAVFNGSVWQKVDGGATGNFTSVNVTGTITSAQSINTNNAVTVTANAGTVPVTSKLNTFTNSSAAGMTITIATASAVDGQQTIVRIYDFSAVAQTITWVNTENSLVTAPTTSNGSTTLPLTVGFMYNAATSKWRCIAFA